MAEGQLQLNAFDPVMVHELLTGMALLTNAMTTFRVNCVEGIPAILREPIDAPGNRPACLFIHGSGTSGAEPPVLRRPRGARGDRVPGLTVQHADALPAGGAPAVVFGTLELRGIDAFDDGDELHEVGAELIAEIPVDLKPMKECQ